MWCFFFFRLTIIGDVDDDVDVIHCWNSSDVTDAVRLGLVRRRTSSVTRCIRRTMSGGAFSRNHFSMASVWPSNSWPIASAPKPPWSHVDDDSLELMVHGEMGTGERRRWSDVVVASAIALWAVVLTQLAASLTEKLMLCASSPLSGLHMFAECADWDGREEYAATRRSLEMVCVWSRRLEPFWVHTAKWQYSEHHAELDGSDFSIF